MPKIAIAKEVYERIEDQARKEGVPVSKLVEKLLEEATKRKIVQSCPRCAFRF
jgi:predicted CopG family antitoxin